MRLEIRGPYYSAYGPRHLADVLETMGAWVDGVKYAGGSFALMPPEAVKAINKTAHEHDVYVSTGGWIENVLRFGPDAVVRSIDEAKSLGFDVIEISAGFISLPTESMLRLVKMVKKAGLKAKPELGIQFGAGGATSAEELAAEGTKDVGWLIAQGERVLDAGADIIMIESEGMTESVTTWRTGVAAAIIDKLRARESDVRSCRSAGVRMVCQELRKRDELFVDHGRLFSWRRCGPAFGARRARGAHPKPRRLISAWNRRPNSGV